MVPMMLTVEGTALMPTSATETVGMAEATASGFASACVMRHATSDITSGNQQPADRPRDDAPV